MKPNVARDRMDRETATSEPSMLRHRALQVLLVLFGSFCVGTGYLLVKSLMGRWPMSQGDQMILGIFFPIGVFLLLAVRNPGANRTLILAVAWSNLCHATVMTIQSLQPPRSAPSDMIPLAIMAMISVGLIALAPRRTTQSAAASAELTASLPVRPAGAR